MRRYDHSGGQEVPRIKWNGEVVYHIQKSPLYIPIVRQINPADTLPAYFTKVRFQVLTPTGMSRATFWDTVSCRLVKTECPDD